MIQWREVDIEVVAMAEKVKEEDGGGNGGDCRGGEGAVVLAEKVGREKEGAIVMAVAMAGKEE